MATGTAGDLYVGIFGDQTALDAMFRALPSQATGAGKQSGTQFSAGFSSSFSGLSAKVGKGLGLGLADQLARGMAEALKGDKTIGEAITDTIKNIPIIGAVAGLVEAGIGAAMGTFEAERGAASATEAAAKLNASASRRFALVKGIVELESKLKEDAARARGDEKEAAKIRLDAVRAEEKVLQQEAEYAKRDNVIREKEQEQTIKLSELRKAVALQAFEQEIKRIDDAKQKQLDADAEIAAKEMKAIDAAKQKQIDADADAAAKAAEEMAKDAADLAKLEEKNRREDMDARAEAKADAEADYASIASGSASTALGAFKFEAYPPSMQKVVQERTMKAVEKLATQRAETAGVF